ncbi:MAG: MBL fold metallo-hydrolase [Bacteroides sp.]|nr:MBL fold metallo-hydrolase [Bacteroides sp.]
MEKEQVNTDKYTVKALMNAFWTETSYLKFDKRRLDIMDSMQEYADLCSNTEFKEYYAADEEKATRMEEGSILLYHREALEKVLEELQKEEVPEGKVVLWQVYNMGYIVKTPSHCFGIDVKHKDAAKFAPYLEFLLITHAHEDHYTTDLTDAMTELGKPVYSNFVNNKYKITESKTIKLVDDIEVEVNITDHNATLPNFVVTYQVDCGEDTGNCVIFHVGDSYNHKQLNPTKEVDIFIPHLAVGMDMAAAVAKIKPEIVLMSHILEMDHPVSQWRWSYQYGVARCQELARDKVYLPVWGEKINYEIPKE